MKYNLHLTVFIVENNRFIREVKALKVTSGFATLCIMDSDDGIKLWKSRLLIIPGDQPMR